MRTREGEKGIKQRKDDDGEDRSVLYDEEENEIRESILNKRVYSQCRGSNEKTFKVRLC